MATSLAFAQADPAVGLPPQGTPPTPVPVQPAPSRQAPRPSTAASEDGQSVALNFDYADISMVIQTIAEILKMNYILAPGVSGKVTIQTSDRIARSELPFVLEKILEVNNLTMIKSGDFYKIIPIASIGKETLATIPPKGAAEGPQMVIRIFTLRQIAPSEVIKLFAPLKSPQGVFIPHDPANILFVLETPERLAMYDELIASVDVDIYQNVQVELHQIKNAQAEELAKDLNQVLTAVTSVPGRLAAKFKLIPVKSINSILFVSAEPGLGAIMNRWVADLDQPASADSEKIFVCSLNHASAENLASILREVYADKSTQAQARSTAVPPQASKPTSPRAPAAETQAPPAAPPRIDGGGGEGAVSGKVKVVPDKDTNSLIIQTAPWNYPSILETIRKLDKRPDQVLIEVTVAEIRLDDEDDFGIEWSLLSQGAATTGGETFNVNTTARNVYNKELTVGPSLGFSYMVSQAGRLSAVLNAYAKASKLNIISRPHIIASNNKEAKIDVGEEVPIITTQTRAGDGDNTENVDQTIEYRSTGIILTVTPHINENREVTLDVTQEVSEAQQNLLGGTDSPIILKRSAKTSMVVRDNETLIIGGLIQETKERSREGIPFLSRIPLLGYLFGTTKDTVTKTELVVLMTPRVISTSEEGRRLTDDYLSGTVILKKGLNAK